MGQYRILVILLGFVVAVPALAQDKPTETTGIAMSIDSMVRSIRDAYVDQFRTYAESRNDPATGRTEIKIKVNRSERLFRSLICVDYLRTTADGPQPEIFEPERQLYFDGFETDIGAVTVAFSSFGWDGVGIRYQSPRSAEEIFGAWFEHWFDPEDERLDPKALLNGNIHNIVLAEGMVSIDMGTAPPEAFHELIAAFEAAGVTRLEIGGDL
jgi:hypothetical protein